MLIYLSLGSNTGNREKNIYDALNRLNNSSVKVLKASAVYQTEPVGYKHQPDFYNAAVKAETELLPFELLDVIKSIEKSMGRKQAGTRRWGPRIIDIDIVFYGNIMINSGRLIIPHAEMQKRLFVLVPLTEIAGNFVHPGLKLSIKELVKMCGNKEKITRIGAVNE